MNIFGQRIRSVGREKILKKKRLNFFYILFSVKIQGRSEEKKLHQIFNFRDNPRSVNRPKKGRGGCINVCENRRIHKVSS